eukprot:TRINITY_DN28229_c0_g1_i1.p2 TRINITY_DN28229_c0_g1~~TRINITY_DN28229_c0_g1_i1.p2  ORF type:complete len:324 (+),score=101.25 TRINITY_DN28229_c0_g1_i1:243-1214(+)
MHDRKREELNDAARAKIGAKIAAYKELCSTCLALRKKKEYTRDALKILDKILMVNPEFYTMWNYRREILQHLMGEEAGVMLWGSGGACEGVAHTQDAISWRHVSADLQFNATIIEKRDHKSYCVWHHRRWLINAITDPQERAKQLRVELGLCGKLLKVDDRNFHCWGHRQFAAERLGSLGLFEAKEELSFTKQRVESNFSNYSAYHRRSKLLLGETDAAARSARVSSEIEMVQNAFYTEPNDQSGWIYAHWLLDSASSPEGAESVTSAATELLQDDPSLKWPRLSLLSLGGALEEDGGAESVKRLVESDPLRAGYYNDLLAAQ